MKSTTICVCLIIMTSIVLSSAADWVCKQGVPYKENQCSECTCMENNVLKCGDRGCLDPIESKLFNCEVGTTSQIDCNECDCVKDLGTICTNHPCPKV